MEKLSIPASTTSPAILLDSDEGIVSIIGRSIPKDAPALYEPVMAWVAEYVEQTKGPCEVLCRLDYFNTSTQKYLSEMLKIIARIRLEDRGELTVNWYYEEDDEEMMRVGQIFARIAKITFQYKSYEFGEYDQ